jgi:L-rhamnose mutarotase
MQSIKRYGMIAGLRPDKLEDYKKLHAAVWPDVLKMIEQCHIRNYSIYVRQLNGEQPLLFSYFEYTGNDFAADMARMAADQTTQKWWALCAPCLTRPEGGANGEWWKEMQELFHID